MGLRLREPVTEAGCLPSCSNRDKYTSFEWFWQPSLVVVVVPFSAAVLNMAVALSVSSPSKLTEAPLQVNGGKQGA